MLSSPHLSRTLIYNVSRWWGLYLNKCGGAFYSKALEGPGANIPFLLEPIPFELKEGAYVGPILSVPLLDLIAVQRMSGSGRNGSGICDSGTFSDRSSGGGGGGGGSGAGGDVFAVKVKKVGAPGWGGAQGCGLDMMCTCLPCPFGMGRTWNPTGRDRPPYPAQTNSLQELVPVWGILGGL